MKVVFVFGIHVMVQLTHVLRKIPVRTLNFPDFDTRKVKNLNGKINLEQRSFKEF